ncbi:MAG: hypothetical protein K2X66_13240 [Cyanobacteria bacterium]|nr:hypothetical protein [Cyanobacteriota bacterium]
MKLMTPPSTAFSSTNTPFKMENKNQGNPFLGQCTTGFSNASSPKFQGGLFEALSEFDFTEAGKSTMRHNQLIYASCIVSRVLAASTRSWNEVREHALRDILGWTFWFYATPMIQRGFLKVFAPKDIKPMVIQNYPKPEGTGLWATLKRINWHINPLSRWNIPSSAQIEERMHQALGLLKKDSEGMAPEVLKKSEELIQKTFGKAKQFRNYSSAFGLVVAIALLGIGIPMLNVLMTRRNVAAAKNGPVPGH